MPIPRRPTPAELENLTNKHAVEFAVTYKYGAGPNGAGGQYYLFSGDAGSVSVPLEADHIEYIDYAASKGAVDTLTRVLALEVAAEGIRVNAVRPGLIYTDMHTSDGEASRVDRLKSRIPLQRGGHPQEIAEAILWLASEKSSFVTGSFIDAAGGL